MSYASRRAIETGIQLGSAIGQPAEDALMLKAKQEFERQQEEDRFNQQIALLAAHDPNFAASLTQIQPGQTVDGQKSMQPLALTGQQQAAWQSNAKVPEEATQELGKYAYNPKAFKSAEMSDAVTRADQEFNLRKRIADYQSGLDLKKPRELTPGATIGTFDESGNFKPSYTAPKPDQPRTLEFKDVGDAIVALDPITAQEKSRIPKVKDAKYEKTDGGLLEILPDGSKSIVPGTQPTGQKPPTETQVNLQIYGKRMAASDDILNKLNFTPNEISGIVPNRFKNSERQQYDQAQRDFINAALRRESGAAISPSEFDSAQKQYFAQPGDGPEVKAQKKANRQLVVQEFQRLGGGTPDQPVTSPASAGSGLEGNETAQVIRDHLRNGQITRDQARKMLESLK